MDGKRDLSVWVFYLYYNISSMSVSKKKIKNKYEVHFLIFNRTHFWNPEIKQTVGDNIWRDNSQKIYLLIYRFLDRFYNYS